jgi:hypothetical protein
MCVFYVPVVKTLFLYATLPPRHKGVARTLVYLIIYRLVVGGIEEYSELALFLYIIWWEEGLKLHLTCTVIGCSQSGVIISSEKRIAIWGLECYSYRMRFAPWRHNGDPTSDLTVVFRFIMPREFYSQSQGKILCAMRD